MVQCVLTRDDVVEVDGQRGVENEVNEEHEDEDVDGDLTHGQPVKRHAPVGYVQVDALKQTQGAKIIKKFGAWIGAQLKILCSKFRKLRSGDYKEIGVRFLCSV